MNGTDKDTTQLQPSRMTRRVVTGHDANGKSVILSDGDCPVNAALWHEDFSVNAVWRIDQLPADNSVFKEPFESMELEPPLGGNVCFISQFPPDSEYIPTMQREQGMEALGESGVGALSSEEGQPHALMHKTNSVDYIIVLSGEIYAVMEKDEVLLKQGDVLIQRGTNHAWSNRSNTPCVMATILHGAKSLE